MFQITYGQVHGQKCSMTYTFATGSCIDNVGEDNVYIPALVSAVCANLPLQELFLLADLGNCHDYF